MFLSSLATAPDAYENVLVDREKRRDLGLGDLLRSVGRKSESAVQAKARRTAGTS